MHLPFSHCAKSVETVNRLYCRAILGAGFTKPLRKISDLVVEAFSGKKRGATRNAISLLAIGSCSLASLPSYVHTSINGGGSEGRLLAPAPRGYAVEAREREGGSLNLFLLLQEYHADPLLTLITTRAMVLPLPGFWSRKG